MLNFISGATLAQQLEIWSVDPSAIILHLEARKTTIEEFDVNGGGLCIDCVLKELFYCWGEICNNLGRAKLKDRVLIQSSNHLGSF